DMENLNIIFLLVILLFDKQECAPSDVYDEELSIKQLQSGHVYSQFQFVTTWNVNVFEQQIPPHYNFFPKSFGEILSKFGIVELHFSMTQGRWRHNKWGYPLDSAPTGVELWVWFHPNLNSSVVDKNWSGLVHSLSGQFCSSINFISKAETTSPEFSFKPLGVWPEDTLSPRQHLRYATIPRETVCTENLTPWKKMLPCGNSGGVGLASLLNAVKLYDSSYHSLAVHLRSVCQAGDCSKLALEYKQSVASVFDPHHRGFNGGWNLRSLFGGVITSRCPLARNSQVIIHTDKIDGLNPNHFEKKIISVSGKDVEYAVFDLTKKDLVKFPFDVQVKMKNRATVTDLKSSYILVHKYTTGYGEEYGGSTCIVRNTHAHKNITLSYLDVIPYFARVYLHTLKLQVNGVQIKPDNLKYTPCYHRERPAKLEFLFTIPPQSDVTISIQFEKIFQDWMQHPPDSHHGFYMSSSVISGIVPFHEELVETIPSLHHSMFRERFGTTSDEMVFRRIYSEPLLLRIPSPDFSMPYNVICLTCTVIAIGFGSIYNLTTRTFQVEEVKEKRTLKEKILGLFRKTETLENEEEENSDG
uniref:GPI transamidase component PIG-T n=2 Tax=Clytia hemisphaerica TaxID=252671 RepID=A0A7M5XCM6_9CNID